MSEKFVNIDRETPMLLPVDMREWLPEDHLPHFVVIDVVYSAYNMKRLFNLTRTPEGGVLASEMPKSV